jgi:hypothetical protein
MYNTPYFGRQNVERAIEDLENPSGMQLNDSKDRVILPGGTLKRMLQIIDEQEKLIKHLEWPW